MKRYAAYNKDGKLIRRVFADRPRDALELVREVWILIRPVWYVVEDPMAQITRGD